MPTKNTKINIKLARQVECKAQAIPSSSEMKAWIAATLNEVDYPHTQTELTVCLVEADESARLNHEFRGKDKATNVLSFPYQVIPGFTTNYLGDLVICAALVAQEAQEQKIAVKDHWAHLIIHGMLHLLGYDHSENQEAEIMEALEVKILNQFGISDPYH